jgi:iron(III) transport system permease protein
VKIPKILLTTNVFILTIFLMPIFYMFWRFANFSRNISAFLKSWDVFSLLFNTLTLFLAVVLTSLFIGLLVSIFTVRYELPASKILFSLTILPLVIPSYIGALTYVSAFSPRGLFVDIFSSFGLNEISGIDGFVGSWIVLTLFTYPYVQLVCSSALRNLDSTVEDAARSLGVKKIKMYTSVVLPRLKKPIIYSSLLVGLYVISDFGAVSLMKYGTMTKAIYSYYVININGDPVIFYSTILIFLALLISFAQRGSDISRSAKVSGTPREIEKIKLSKKPKILVLIFFFVLIFFSLFVPVSVLGYWLFRGLAQGNSVSGALSGILGSLSAATVTSILAMIIATPIVVMISQYRSKFGDLFEKVTLTLYGLPHIAVGISMLFITIKIFPSIYQTFITLIISYLIVFLPQAVGGGQASMEQVKLSYIEASSGLGFSKIDTFFKITFPLIYRGLLAGAALVFLSTMKELPQTLLLRPTGFSTMAVDIWSNASEALFTQAAFSAFILLAISAFPTYILSTRNLTN